MIKVEGQKPRSYQIKRLRIDSEWLLYSEIVNYVNYYSIFGKRSGNI